MSRTKEHSTKTKSPSYIKRNGSFMAFLLGMAMLGFLAQFQWVGYGIIAIYAFAAFMRSLPAATTFLLALLMLGVVPVSIVVGNWPVAQNFAAYSFVLFILGIAQLIVELRREMKANSKIHNDTDRAV